MSEGNITIRRNSAGQMSVYVGPTRANGAIVTGMQTVAGEQCWLVAVPSKFATLGEDALPVVSHAPVSPNAMGCKPAPIQFTPTVIEGGAA